jgi:hypothetical protein
VAGSIQRFHFLLDVTQHETDLLKVGRQCFSGNLLDRKAVRPFDEPSKPRHCQSTRCLIVHEVPPLESDHMMSPALASAASELPR